ncbi:MAG: hypothetical protein LBL20_07310, partial [Treponema sp.]|nr:hypothetical protein [Treponema sp.]
MAIFVIGVCLRQTPSLRRRTAQETAASMPHTPQQFFTAKSNRTEGSRLKKFLLAGPFFDLFFRLLR